MPRSYSDSDSDYSVSGSSQTGSLSSTSSGTRSSRSASTSRSATRTSRSNRCTSCRTARLRSASVPARRHRSSDRIRRAAKNTQPRKVVSTKYRKSRPASSHHRASSRHGKNNRKKSVLKKSGRRNDSRVERARGSESPRSPSERELDLLDLSDLSEIASSPRRRSLSSPSNKPKLTSTPKTSRRSDLYRQSIINRAMKEYERNRNDSSASNRAADRTRRSSHSSDALQLLTDSSRSHRSLDSVLADRSGSRSVSRDFSRDSSRDSRDSTRGSDDSCGSIRSERYGKRPIPRFPSTLQCRMFTPLFVRSTQNVKVDPIREMIIIDNNIVIFSAGMNTRDHHVALKNLSKVAPAISNQTKQTDHSSEEEQSSHSVHIGEKVIVIRRVTKLKRSEYGKQLRSTDSRQYNKIAKGSLVETRKTPKNGTEYVSAVCLNGTDCRNDVYKKSEMMLLVFSKGVPEINDDIINDMSVHREVCADPRDRSKVVSFDENISVAADRIIIERDTIVDTRVTDVNAIWGGNKTIVAEESRSYDFHSRGLDGTLDYTVTRMTNNESFVRSRNSSANTTRSGIQDLSSGSMTRPRTTLLRRSASVNRSLNNRSSRDRSYDKNQTAPSQLCANSSVHTSRSQSRSRTPSLIEISNSSRPAESSSDYSDQEVSHRNMSVQSDPLAKRKGGMPQSPRRRRDTSVINRSFEANQTAPGIILTKSPAGFTRNNTALLGMSHLGESSVDYPSDSSARSVENRSTRSAPVSRSRRKSIDLSNVRSHSRSVSRSPSVQDRSFEMNQTAPSQLPRQVSVSRSQSPSIDQSRSASRNSGRGSIVCGSLNSSCATARASRSRSTSLNRSIPARMKAVETDLNVSVDPNDTPEEVEPHTTVKTLTLVANVNGERWRFTCNFNLESHRSEVTMSPDAIELDGQKLWERTEKKYLTGNVESSQNGSN